MSPKLPKHAVLIRWGSFQLNIIGRGAILGWASVLATAFGGKLLGYF